MFLIFEQFYLFKIFSVFLVCINGIGSVCNVKYDTDKENFHVFQIGDLLFCRNIRQISQICYSAGVSEKLNCLACE